jgi:uncharacterized protein (TIGR00159 family)
MDINTLLEFLRFNPLAFKFVLMSIQIKDVFDILFTAVLVYVLLWFLRKTKSLPAILGVVILLVMYALSYWLNFSLTYKILQTLIGAFIVILVIIFQDEIKRFFYLIGSVGLKRNNIVLAPQTIDNLVETLFVMANRRVGALVVIPGRESIKPYVTGGINLEAQFSNPLIFSLFDPHSPGHDGAIILENDRIKKFAVYLPLSKDIHQLKNYGTRHRAGLGISEKTDALSIIVSEEKGIVSVAQDRILKVINNEEELTLIINKFLRSLHQESHSQTFGQFWRGLRGNSLFAVLSFIFAASIWLIISYPNLGIIQKNFIMPIEFTNIDVKVVVENVKPLEVIATFSGRNQDFKLLDPSLLKITMDLTEMTEPDKYTITLNKSNLKYPSSLSLISLDPNKVQFMIVLKTENLLKMETTTTK